MRRSRYPGVCALLHGGVGGCAAVHHHGGGIGRARADRGDEVTTGASALFGMPLIVLVVWYLGFLALILQQFVF